MTLSRTSCTHPGWFWSFMSSEVTLKPLLSQQTADIWRTSVVLIGKSKFDKHLKKVLSCCYPLEIYHWAVNIGWLSQHLNSNDNKEQRCSFFKSRTEEEKGRCWFGRWDIPKEDKSDARNVIIRGVFQPLQIGLSRLPRLRISKIEVIDSPLGNVRDHTVHALFLQSVHVSGIMCRSRVCDTQRVQLQTAKCNGISVVVAAADAAAPGSLGRAHWSSWNLGSILLSGTTS